MDEVNITPGRPASPDGRSPEELAVYALLDSLSVTYDTATHAAAATMEECARVERVIGAEIAKNLFLCNRQQTQFYLLMLPGAKVFKTRLLSSQLGCARLSFATDDRMWQLLRTRPGAVSPLGLMNDGEGRVRLIVDRDLMVDEFIGCHPCVNTATLRLRLSDLLDTVVPAIGHSLTMVTL